MLSRQYCICTGVEDLKGGFPPFQLTFGVPSCIIQADGRSILMDLTIDHRTNDLMACRVWKATRVTKQLLSQGRSGAEGSVKFQVGTGF